MTLKPKKPGDELLADDINALIARTLAGVGPGLSMQQTPGGTIIALAALFQYLIPARITAVSHVQTDPPTYTAADFTYTAVAIGNPAATVTSALPVYGRNGIAENMAITPASVGHLCFIVRVQNDDATFTSDLWILTERPITAVCEEA